MRLARLAGVAGTVGLLAAVSTPAFAGGTAHRPSPSTKGTSPRSKTRRPPVPR